MTTPATEGLEADTNEIPLVVDASPEIAGEPGSVPGLMEVLQNLGRGDQSSPLWTVALCWILGLGVIGGGVLMLLYRRRPRTPR